MEVPHESVRSEARDERYHECRDLLNRFEGLRERLNAASNPVSGSEGLEQSYDGLHGICKVCFILSLGGWWGCCGGAADDVKA